MLENPRVAVEVEDIARGARISKRALLDSVRESLQRQDKLVVVAMEAERKKLNALLRKSLSAGASEKYACEVGERVTANSLEQVSIRAADRRRLFLKLLSAEKGCQVASAVVDWYPKKSHVSIAEGVTELVRGLKQETQYPWGKISPVPGPAPAPQPEEDTSYEALARRAAEAKAALEEAALEEAEKKQREERAAYQAKLEKAWTSVKGFMETKALRKRDRLGALSKFLRDFPSDNPHEETAKGYAKLLEAGKELNAAPEGMAEVPAGEFYMGCNERVESECASDEKPGKTVYVGAFRIDETEITVAAYQKCVDAGACARSTFQTKSDSKYCNWGYSDRGTHPMNCVNWAGADGYCRWAGKRLPSEKEWEKAARGTDGRKYAWGNTKVSCSYAVLDDGGNGCGRNSTWPVGSKPSGNSPFGAKDMIGNVDLGLVFSKREMPLAPRGFVAQPTQVRAGLEPVRQRSGGTGRLRWVPLRPVRLVL